MDERRILELARVENKLAANNAKIYKEMTAKLEERDVTWADLFIFLSNHKLRTAGGFAKFFEKVLRNHKVWNPREQIKESRTKEAISWMWMSYMYMNKALRVFTNWSPKKEEDT